MYVILVYDFGEKRVGKMLKLCRKYLNWIQNSVFEGEISEVKLKELLQKAHQFIDRKEDCIILFKHPSINYMDKEVIGRELCSTDRFM
ncbi:MAG: CRISPR-associated endonuclease Cas2 [Bacteroidaceae bacterium]|nr:CRISPR-associated endonuclease Cas2 [Bacteroidaceae bacterium]